MFHFATCYMHSAIMYLVLLLNCQLAAIFQNGRTKYNFVNISTSGTLRIVILVCKRTYLRAIIPIKLIANTYLHECGSHFPKWPTKRAAFAHLHCPLQPISQPHLSSSRQV